jgi:hypothetical protein
MAYTSYMHEGPRYPLSRATWMPHLRSLIEINYADLGDQHEWTAQPPAGGSTDEYGRRAPRSFGSCRSPTVIWW